MGRFRNDLIVGGVSGLIGAIAGAFVAWAVAASVTIAAWMAGLMAALIVGSLLFAGLTALRLARWRQVRYDRVKRVYFAASPRAVNPGPFCPKCLEVEGKRVSVELQSSGSHWCSNCKEAISPAGPDGVVEESGPRVFFVDW